jgi:hypothetical protein
MNCFLFRGCDPGKAVVKIFRWRGAEGEGRQRGQRHGGQGASHEKRMLSSPVMLTDSESGEEMLERNVLL